MIDTTVKKRMEPDTSAEGRDVSNEADRLHGAVVCELGLILHGDAAKVDRAGAEARLHVALNALAERADMITGKRTPAAVGAFLSAWEALGVAVGLGSLTAGEAARKRPGVERAALSAALTVLGYPEALRSGSRLGAALRRLSGVRDGRGRYLSSSRTAVGSIWYVVTPTAHAPAEATGGESREIERGILVTLVRALHARRTPEERRLAAEEARAQLQAPGIGWADRVVAETTLALEAVAAHADSTNSSQILVRQA